MLLQTGNHSSGRALSFGARPPLPAKLGATAKGEVGRPDAVDSSRLVVREAKRTAPSTASTLSQMFPVDPPSNPAVIFAPPVASVSRKPMFDDDSRVQMVANRLLPIRDSASVVGSSFPSSINLSK